MKNIGKRVRKHGFSNIMCKSLLNQIKALSHFNNNLSISAYIDINSVHCSNILNEETLFKVTH